MTALEVFFPNARLPELGKVKIGGLGAARTAAGGTSYRQPVKADCFTLTTLTRGPDVGGARGDLIPDADLMASLKEYASPDGKLRQLPIYVLSNDLDEVMQTAWVWYGGRTVAARSDGFKVTWFNDRATGRPLPTPLVEDWKPEYLELKTPNGKATLFKQHTVFNCVIAANAAKWGGVFKFRTTSVISARQMYAGLVHLATLTGGILVGLPLMLVVRPIQVAPEGKATTVYVVHVEMRGSDLQQIQIEAVKRATWQLENRKQVQSLQLEYRRLLLPPGQEAPADASEINEEFQPETAGDKPPAPPPDPYWTRVMQGEVVDVELEPTAPEAPVAKEPAAVDPAASVKPADDATDPAETLFEAPAAPQPPAPPSELRQRVNSVFRAIAKHRGTPFEKPWNAAMVKMGMDGETIEHFPEDRLAGLMVQANKVLAMNSIDASPYLPGGPEYQPLP